MKKRQVNRKLLKLKDKILKPFKRKRKSITISTNIENDNSKLNEVNNGELSQEELYKEEVNQEEVIIEEPAAEKVKEEIFKVIKNESFLQKEEPKFEHIPEQHKITSKYKKVVSELVSMDMPIEDISKAVDMSINNIINLRENEIFSSIVRKMWELDFSIESIIRVTGLKVKRIADIIINSEKLDEIEVEQGKIGEIIRNLVKMNVSLELISEASGLSIEEIGMFIDNSGVSIIARNLLLMNTPLEVIIKGTGLSLETIDALRA